MAQQTENNNMTAVEWLVEQMVKEISKHVSIEITPRGSELIEQAKQIEKERMIEFAEKYSFDMISTSAEGFYNETYGKSNE